MADCWSCGAERGDAALCGTCGRIQPVYERADHFSTLGLPRRMRLARADLDRAYREVSKRVHPDRFPREEPVQRKLALAHTERVNEAYKALKDPRTRGEYLLQLAGVEVASETSRTEDSGFLLEMLDKQEAVEAAGDEASVSALEAETQERVDELLERVTGVVDDGQGTLEGARAALVELRYLRRLLDQIAVKKEELY